MKNVASLAIALIFTIITAVPAIAQMDELKNSTPEERSGMLTQMMQKSLSLDEKATASVSAINLKYAKEAQTLMDSSSPKLEKLMTFRKNSNAKDAELKAVLTPEQFARYQQNKSEMQELVKQKLLEKHQGGE